MKYAILSMDIEDWYHLDYLKNKKCDKSYVLLDGINRFCDIIESYSIPATFFVVGELINDLSTTLTTLETNGHDIAVHGWDHTRPITMDLRCFREDVIRSKETLEDLLGKKVSGYRAPCFSIDRKRLNILKEIGFGYDSSRIFFQGHPLYHEINIDGFDKISNNIFISDNFFEFQVSTLNLYNKSFPVSGGGFLRIFPWILMRNLIKKYISSEDFYVLYIHPFELSSMPNPPFPSKMAIMNKLRFSTGRSTVDNKLESLIELLKSYDFEFTTFLDLRNKLLNEKK